MALKMMGTIQCTDAVCPDHPMPNSEMGSKIAPTAEG
jgi:hypothetical protein